MSTSEWNTSENVHKFNNRLFSFRDALLTSFINSATSFVSGFVIFSVLGYMAHTSGQKIEDVATEGPGLVFDVYPGNQWQLLKDKLRLKSIFYSSRNRNNARLSLLGFNFLHDAFNSRSWQLLWWIRSYNHRPFWRIPDNQKKSRDLRWVSFLALLCCWLGELHARRLLLLPVVGQVRSRLFNFNCRFVWGGCGELDLRNEKILLRHQRHDRIFAGKILDLLLEVRSSTVSYFHHSLWLGELWTFEARRLHLPLLGEFLRLGDCDFLNVNDSADGNL